MAPFMGNFIVKLSNIPNDTSKEGLQDIISLSDLAGKIIFTLERKRNRAYLYVSNARIQKEVIEFFNSLEHKGHILKAELETEYDPKAIKRINAKALKQAEMEHASLVKRVEEVVTPYVHMPYSEQLKLKQEKAETAIKDLTSDILELNPRLKKFVAYQRNRTGGLVCSVDEIVPSPVINHYRNKCEFSIGKKDRDKVVGFAVGSEKSNQIQIGPVKHLKHINQQMKKAVQYFQEYLEDTAHDPFSPVTTQGVWRHMTVRTTNTGDFIIIIHIHPQHLIKMELELIEERIVTFFLSKAEEDPLFKPTAIYFEERGQLVSGEKPVMKHAYGDCKYMEELILGNRFRASPDSFLQVNTAACEVLYEKIAEIAVVNRKTAVLDICCGVGTIGVSIAKNAGQLSGVDFIEGAIEHANFNAKNNNVPARCTNEDGSLIEDAPVPLCRYYHGKAEDYISIMLRECKQYDMLAILDPPRAGIGNHVIHALRMNDSLRRLIYVSCDAEKARGNFRTLVRSRSKNTRGECFIPVRVIPVDMFPHTKHLELIILFEKYDEAKWEKIMQDEAKQNDGLLQISKSREEEEKETEDTTEVEMDEDANLKKRKTESEIPDGKRSCNVEK